MATGEERPAYEIRLTKAAERDLERLVKSDRKALDGVDRAILGLADDPRPHGSTKIRGSDGLHRVRSGDYRVVYSVDDDGRIVTVELVGDRKEIYRRL